METIQVQELHKSTWWTASLIRKNYTFLKHFQQRAGKNHPFLANVCKKKKKKKFTDMLYN